MDTQTKTEAIDHLEAAFVEMSLFLDAQEEKALFKKVKGKWSIAQQTDHLTIANTVTTIGFATPKAAVKALFGERGRNSYSYEEVIFRYQSKLASGAKASFAFQPRLSIFPNKKLLLSLWHRSVDGLLNAARKWEDADLDSYQLNHPILGKLTMREMLYFTTYHVRHHLGSMRELVK